MRTGQIPITMEFLIALGVPQTHCVHSASCMKSGEWVLLNFLMALPHQLYSIGIGHLNLVTLWAEGILE